MKNLMKCAAILAATLLAFGFASCKTNSDDDSGTVSVTSIELNKTSTSIGVDETETLKATVKPDNATDKTVTWSSDKIAVATVDNGVVTAVSKGTATITAKAGDKTATCTVTVADIIDLSKIAEDTIIADGTIVTGTLGGSYKISIADGATVTLKNVTITSLAEDASFAGINCPGDATLVIEGTNTVESGNASDNYYPAIYIKEGKTLTIQGTGSLTATSYGYGAGIGGGNSNLNGGNIIINSGTIVAECKKMGAGIGAGGATCGDITINGGTITATGGRDKGAGIGGGAYPASNCGNIVIKDGTVTATGGGDSAGIGAGSCNEDCGNITISGGTIVVTGGAYAAGIGTGWAAKCGTITITDGVDVVTATKGEGSPCSIGKGKDGSNPSVCGKITIGGDEYPDGISKSPFTYDPDLPTYNVTVTSGTAIPSKAVPGIIVTIKASTPAEGKAFDKWTTTTTGVEFDDASASETTFEMPASNVAVTATYKDAPKIIDLSTLTADTVVANGFTITGTLANNVKISIADGATVTLKNAKIIGSDEESYKWAGLTCEGDATITLEGTNNVIGFYSGNPGIYVPKDKTLTIKGSGSLTADANGYAAGIGGGGGKTGSDSLDCGNITIEGGVITATGKYASAGIGGGPYKACGDITITGGTVTATGGGGMSTAAAGIGGGYGGSCGNISITGGTVTATGAASAAGIGCGKTCNNDYPAKCGTITITSGVTKVTATKGAGALCSIGKGYVGSYNAVCGKITIGGTVYWDGSDYQNGGDTKLTGDSYTYPES